MSDPGRIGFKTMEPTCYYVPYVTDGVEMACTRHQHMAPCPHNGEPPFPNVPVHIDTRPERAAAIAHARACTGGARDIVVHTDFSTNRDHRLDDDAQCWCNPLVVR